MIASLEGARAAVNRELAVWLDEALAAGGGIADSIRYAVLAPGKRIRPLLVIGAWEAAGGRTESGPNGRAGALCRLALGPELVHAYSLVHDDLPCMDDDDLRRGRPTVHVRYGERVAILAGAAIQPLAVLAVGDGAAGLELEEAVTARLIAVLARASGGRGMVGGQLLDLEAERADVGFERLERIHLGKTASLISACCTMGGLAARAPEETVDRLTRFGISIGLAFQTVDDILDVTGSARAMGKVGGRDEALGKATTPSILGLDGARERARELGRAALEELAPLPTAHRLREIGRLILERDR